MTETIEVQSAYGTYYYIDSASSSDVLTNEQMEANVQCMYNVIHNRYPSWTVESIAALCGNAQSEGALNPNQWEYGYGKDTKHGYGLWQWTPATKFLDWCASNAYPKNDILHQVMRLEYERTSKIQYYQTSKYPFSFTSFLEAEHSVDELARAWLYNYERPKDPAASESIRVERSNRWYAFLTGTEPAPPDPDVPEPDDPDPEPKKRKAMPLYMYPIGRGRR